MEKEKITFSSTFWSITFIGIVYFIWKEGFAKRDTDVQVKMMKKIIRKMGWNKYDTDTCDYE